MGTSSSAPKAFISYKWEGDDVKSWVEQFARDLRKNGVDALLDEWEVGYGDSFIKYMTRNIPAADVFFFVMTPESVRSVEAEEGSGGAVSFEVEIATARKIGGDKLRFVPILLRGEKPAAFLRHSRYVDFRQAKDYNKTFSSLLADITGKRGKPPLLGVGSFQYAIRVYELIPATKGSPVGALMAQIEPYGGFPFYSYESDHPSFWPPRVYEDRGAFTEHIVKFMTDPAHAPHLAKARQEQQGSVTVVTSAPRGPDELTEAKLIEQFTTLRMLCNSDLKADRASIEARLGMETAKGFFYLEGLRKADDDRMPNRLLTIAFKHSQDLELTDVVLDTQIVGTVYDALFNGRRLFDRKATEDMSVPTNRVPYRKDPRQCDISHSNLVPLHPSRPAFRPTAVSGRSGTLPGRRTAQAGCRGHPG